MRSPSKGAPAAPASLWPRLVSAALAAAYFIAIPALVRPHWDGFVAALGGFTGLATLGATGVHGATLLVGNLFFLCLYTLRPGCSERRRSSPRPWPWLAGGAAARELPGLVRLAVGLTVLNNALALAAAYANVPLLRARGMRIWEGEGWPTPFELFWQTIVCVLSEDATFYLSHRLLHSHPALYVRVHKLHHRWHDSLSIAAEATHPLEFLLGNVLPVLVGPLALGPRIHAYTLLAWISWRIAETVDGHSGIELGIHPVRYLPLASSSTAHELHHQINTGNYGSCLKIWDDMMGTALADRSAAGASNGPQEAAAKGKPEPEGARRRRGARLDE